MPSTVYILNILTGMSAYMHSSINDKPFSDTMTKDLILDTSLKKQNTHTHPTSTLLEMNGNRNLPRTDGPYNECMTNIAI